jgi:hypothetical protein
VVTRTPSLPLARSGGYGTPRYSGDHWKSGKEISLSSPPFNFRNFGFGFGFLKVDFLQLVGLFLRLSSTPSPHQFHLFSLPVTATSHHFIFLCGNIRYWCRNIHTQKEKENCLKI